MLIELTVRNFAIISELTLSFRGGLNVLSGETGAGKSVVLRSLGLLMGDKAQSDTVRSGEDQATIEGLFDLELRPDIRGRLRELGLADDEGNLVVRRVITHQGKSKVYINGHLSALSSLRDVVAPLITVTGVGAPLIEMTGQHDSRDLQSRAHHLDLLDHYCGAIRSRLQYTEAYNRLSRLRDEIRSLSEDSRHREQRLDFLVFQRDEIRAANLCEGEEDALAARVQRLRGSAKLIEFAEQAQHVLYGDEQAVTVRLHQLLQRAGELKASDPTLPDRLQSLQQAKSLLEDATYDLREYSRQLLIDPEELNRSEERLTLIRKLQKKYGATSGEILARLAEVEAEIARLEGADSNLHQLEDEARRTEETLGQMAKDLHTRRVNGAGLLAQGVNDELLDLNMKGVRFGVIVTERSELGPTGGTDVEFTIQAGKKDEARALAKFASGGELSRILLALKRVVGHSELPRTYLFDEVDSGVSGETAEKVGRKLRSIAAGQQVICVTHLPQVAAHADVHFFIEKSSQRGHAEMKVVELGKDDRVREIARLISGEKISSTSLEHARQLLLDSSRA